MYAVGVTRKQTRADATSSPSGLARIWDELIDFGRKSKAVVPFLNLTLLLLLFPFHPVLLALLLSVAALSIALFVGSRIARSVWAKRLLLLASGGIALGGLCLGAVGPIVAAPSPLYVFLSPETSVFNSHFVTTRDAQTQVVVFTDPVRKALRPLWRSLESHRLRLLEFDPKGGGGVAFPVHGAYFAEEMLPVGRATRKIQIPLVAPTVEMDFRGPFPVDRMHHGEIRFGISFSTAPAIEADSLIVDGPRWNTVRTATPTDADLLYAATLDEGLSLLAYGTPSEAMAVLELASTIAPSVVERARSLCILGDVTASMLTGFIGSLQSLSVYNAAYATVLPLLAEGKKELPADPALDWAIARLISVYEAPFGRYPERAVHLRSVARTLPQDKSNFLPRRTRDAFLNFRPTIARSGTLTKAEALQAFRSVLGEIWRETPGRREDFGSQVTRALALNDPEFEDAAQVARRRPDTLLRFILENAVASELLSLSGEHAASISRVSALREMASDLEPRIRDAMVERLNVVANAIGGGMFAAFDKADTRDDPWDADPQLTYDPFSPSVRGQAPCVRVFDQMRVLAWKYRDFRDSSEMPPGFMPPVVPLGTEIHDWWDNRFIDEVCHRLVWSMAALEKTGPRDSRAHLTDASLRTVLGPPEELMTDRGGRPFLPWVAIVARLLEAEDGTLHGELKEQLENHFQLSYRDVAIFEKTDQQIMSEYAPELWRLMKDAYGSARTSAH